MAPAPIHQEPQLVTPALQTPNLGPSWYPRFTIANSTEINASPLECLTKVANTTTWPAWNTFAKRVIIKAAPPASDVSLNAPELEALLQLPDHLYPGMRVDLEVYGDPEGSSLKAAERVTLLERFERDGRTGYRIAWGHDTAPYWVLHTERVQEFLEIRRDDGSVATEYRNIFTCGGPVAPLVKLTQMGLMSGGFGRWMHNLKDAVEAEAAGRQQA